MNLSVDVQIANDEDDHPPPSSIEQWVAAAIGQRMTEAELTVRIVDEAEITQLNSDYRGQHKATNVLSFPAEIPDHIDLPLLGDLVVCASVVENEARKQHKKSLHHWAHMIIHGTLHLLGYDHIEDDEAEIMERLEIDILASLNIADPYTITSTINNSTVNL